MIVLLTPAADAAPPLRVQGFRIEYRDAVVLSSERTGVVASAVAPGEVVRAGEPVVRLRDTVLRVERAIALKQAENDIEARFSRKSSDLAALKHERAQAANRAQPGAVSELELRGLRLDAERARLQWESAEHEQALAVLRLKEIDARLEAMLLRAPLPAFVRAVHKQPGELVQQGEAVAELVNTARVRVEGYVSKADALRLGQGSEVEVVADGPPTAAAIRGVVTFVDIKVEPVSGRILVMVEAPNNQGLLREGMTAALVVRGTEEQRRVSVREAPLR